MDPFTSVLYTYYLGAVLILSSVLVLYTKGVIEPALIKFA
jgi:hypothetical protein